MNFGGVRVIAVALRVDSQFNYFLLARQHLDAEFVFLFLLEHLNELLFLECYGLAEVLVFLRLVFIVVVDVASNAASNPPDVDVAGILMDPLFLCELLVQQNHLVQEVVVGLGCLRVLDEGYAILSIE